MFVEQAHKLESEHRLIDYPIAALMNDLERNGLLDESLINWVASVTARE